MCLGQGLYPAPVGFKFRTFFFFFFFFFIYSVLRAFQDYFSSCEMGQSVRKGENREKKTPDTPASRTWLVSHVASAGLEPTNSGPDLSILSVMLYHYYIATANPIKLNYTFIK